MAEPEFVPLTIAVLTTSDSRSLAEDRSGTTLVELLTTAGHRLVDRALCRDDRYQIRAIVSVFVLPGSTGAVRDAWRELIGPQLDARTRPCNLVELMPRLNEHRSEPAPGGHIRPTDPPDGDPS